MLRVADAAWTDFRQAIRRITCSPWLSLVVILTLALAIAANTTIFSLLKPTVLRKLAAADPDRLVAISATDTRTSNYTAIHLDTMRALQSGQGAFSQLGAFSSSIVRLEAEGIGFDTGVEGATSEYFDVLGIRAQAGRVISSSDDPLAPVGVLTARLAMRVFGAESAVGKTIVVDGRPATHSGCSWVWPWRCSPSAA